ncbi:MAG: hypothetical protein KAJ22_03135 [Candidatus Izimaplasma sp.]|nr:hypothetical protein [Candidatus Izimaplasma bacterium]
MFDGFTVERVIDYRYTKTTITHEQYAKLRDASGALICKGYLVLMSNGTTYTITDSINSILLKDSTWFSDFRVYPSE